MSRIKKIGHSIFSGNLLAVANAFYTFATVPLALHYLPNNDEFALMQIAAAVSGYLLLIDFGMTGSAGRILIDHKDNPAGGAYGSVIKINIVVSIIQGLAIAVIGTISSFWLPKLVHVHEGLQRPLFFLIAGQCVLQGFFFVTRVFWNLAQAHQRFDLYNYAQIGTFVVRFVALWIGFYEGWGVYSLLAGSAASSLFGFCYGWIIVKRFNFFPPRGCWGHFDFKLFKEIFLFGSDIFLMVVGFQMANASQIVIITDTLGLGAAAVWSVAIKPFLLGQQLTVRIFDFSNAALSEMIVRGEHARLIRRFRDVTIFTAVTAIFLFGCIALCNESFLHVWTKGRMAWNPLNDFLLALWFTVTSVTRCYVGITGLTKNIGRMRYIYFFEGVTFVVAAIAIVPHFGISGIIAVAIVANLLWSGIFGVRRTVKHFGIPAREAVNGWLATPFVYLLLFALLLTTCKFFTESLVPIYRLIVNALISGLVGLWLAWRFGLTLELQSELGTISARIKNRLTSYLGR